MAFRKHSDALISESYNEDATMIAHGEDDSRNYDIKTEH